MKNALLVIDMQNDYLWEARKPKFAYNTAKLVDDVNTLIHAYADAGHDVIYIRHLIQNLPTNRLLFGYSIAGTPGAELYSGLDIVSKYRFDKLFGDAFTNRYLERMVRERGYAQLCLCGLDEAGCVTATALGAKKRGFEAVICERGVATVMPEKKVSKAREKLGQAGIRRI
ncbi:MAG: cysteine hydrolase [Oscillospiraceae bacterium]|nr:cysteine hydrolase [Oscillospiraceae bacterium]